ncbi:MAG: hypothetical protein ACLQNE_02995 [Thermoguttaceae bacterium]
MGIMQNKVSRRVAIGSIAAGLGGTAIVIRALRGKYKVDLPEGTRPTTLGGRIVTQYDGVNVEIEVPKMVIKTPKDEKKFKELVMEEVKKTPQFAEQNRKLLEEAKNQGRQKILDEFAKLEKETRQTIANATDLSESQKVALLKQSLASLEASKNASLKRIDALALPKKS